MARVLSGVGPSSPDVGGGANLQASGSNAMKGQQVEMPVQEQLRNQGDVTYATAHSFSTDDDTPTKPPVKAPAKKVAPGGGVAAKKAAAEKRRKRDVRKLSRDLEGG